MKLISWLRDETHRTLAGVIASAVALACSLAGLRAGKFDFAWLAVALCGVPIVLGAAKALWREHDIKADLLVSLALIASLCIGEVFAAGEVALIMQLGTLLEDFTAGKARSGIEKLVQLTPRTARVLRDGRESVVPAEEVKPGDTLLVLAGEMVPADGVVSSGETTVDQSAITGESMPADKKPGDEVLSGAVNGYAAFEMTALRPCGDSTMQRMAQLAREAEQKKAPIVRLADRWASWMVVAAVTIAILTTVLTGQFIRGVTVLVVFCPCAFVLATPTAILAGIGSAARHGVLIRSGESLERLSKIRCAAFDKTGTLTSGRPAVTRVRSFLKGTGEDELLRLAAAAEQRSEHPLGKAVAAAGREKLGDLPAAENFSLIPGRGVKALVEGKTIIVGKLSYLVEMKAKISAEQVKEMENAQRDGEAVAAVLLDGCAAGYLTLSDTLRPEAKPMIEALVKSGVTPVLLTGDHAAAARAAAAAAGIEEVRSDLLPEGKMEAVREYAQKLGPVCMVGDGVNDALALSTASAGVAMGATGTGIAVESADAVLVGDELARLPYLFSRAQRVMKKVRENLILSLAINFVAVTLSILGLLNPVTGALMHNCGSVFVVVNAALLLREK